MDNEILKLLNQEIIETRKLATAAQTQAVAAQQQANAAWEGVKELKLQTAQIRELVIITRNEMQLRTRPWWKKLFGIGG